MSFPFLFLLEELKRGRKGGVITDVYSSLYIKKCKECGIPLNEKTRKNDRRRRGRKKIKMGDRKEIFKEYLLPYQEEKCSLKNYGLQ